MNKKLLAVAALALCLNSLPSKASQGTGLDNYFDPEIQLLLDQLNELRNQYNDITKPQVLAWKQSAVAELAAIEKAKLAIIAKDKEITAKKDAQNKSIMATSLPVKTYNRNSKALGTGATMVSHNDLKYQDMPYETSKGYLPPSNPYMSEYK